MADELNLDDDFAFEGASGASSTFPQQCSSLRKNGHVMIKNRPCKIVEMSTSKTGKHGHAKVHLVALDIFTGKKYEDICPSTHNMDVPIVKRKEYTLVDIEDDDYLSLMDESGAMLNELRVPDNDFGQQLKKDFQNNSELMCTVLSACGIDQVISSKTNTSG